MRSDIEGFSRFPKAGGDEDLIAQIYYKYVNELFAWGNTFTNDREIIKDCIQDLFASLINDQEKIDSIRNIKIYLFVSFRNNLMRMLRQKKEFRYEAEFSGDYSNVLRDQSLNQLEQFEHHEMQQSKKMLFRKVFRSLSWRQKRVIYLRYHMKMDYNQICEILQLNYQSARTLVYRSIQRMRDAYTENKEVR